MLKNVEPVNNRYETLYAESFRGEKNDGSSLWWHHHQISATEVSPGASGATFVPPDGNTIGGYNLDVDTEKLYMSSHIGLDWDGVTDVQIRVNFECNVDNTGGADADTVDLKLIAYYKGHACTANRTQTLEETVTVGKSARYKRWMIELTLPYDTVGHEILAGDKFGLILNLADTSEVYDVIINTINWRYRTKYPAVEIA